MLLTDLILLSPLIVIAIFSVFTLLLLGFFRRPGVTLAIVITGLLFALLGALATSGLAPWNIVRLFLLDDITRFYMVLLILIGIVVIILQHQQRTEQPEELYLITSIAVLGALALVASNHFASFFLSLEILSISLYIMISYLYKERSLEAGFKYLILSGSSSAFLLFGIGVSYLATGTLDFSVIAQISPEMLSNPLWLGGIALTLVGIGFKLAVVPFHMWSPDIYEGASPPVAAFVATASKGAVLAFSLRYLLKLGLLNHPTLKTSLLIVAALSIIIGNLLALQQANIKRILAYSSIAHIGYLLIAITSGTSLAVESTTYYITSYIITMLIAFCVISVISRREEEDNLDSYRGMFWRHPWFAGALTISILSLASLPVTAGFIGKLYIVGAAFSASLWAPIVFIVIGSIIGLFYYLRVLFSLYGEPKEPRETTHIPKATALLTGLLVIALLWLGIYPNLFIDTIRSISE